MANQNKLPRSVGTNKIGKKEPKKEISDVASKELINNMTEEDDLQFKEHLAAMDDTTLTEAFHSESVKKNANTDRLMLIYQEFTKRNIKLSDVLDEAIQRFKLNSAESRSRAELGGKLGEIQK